MNLIEAFKNAHGKSIKRSCRASMTDAYITKEGIEYLARRLKSEALLADDWEVVREPLVWEGECNWADNDYIMPIGNGMRLNIAPFVGKRTKIRIEEIIE